MNKPPYIGNNYNRNGGFYMKKLLVLNFILLIGLLMGCTSISNTYLLEGELKYEEIKYEEIKDEIIRFHVLANSDSEEDQELKLKVRDAVIEYVYKDLQNSESIDDSRQYLLDNQNKIEQIAKEVIINSGYDYKITISLSKENFPDKMYGDILFPQGEYEAFRILIGEAEGQNWWCVMFPPLCFVDETKEVIDSYKTRESLEDISGLESGKKEEPKLIFKFKILESLKKIFP